MKRKLFLNKGVTIVGVLVASVIGTIVIAGLTHLSVNVVNMLRKEQRNFNLIQLKENIAFEFKQGDSCTRSLGGYARDAASARSQHFSIKQSGTGAELFKGGQVTDKVKIASVQYVPGADRDERGEAILHFLLSDDTKDALQAAESARFYIKILSYMSETSDVIKECFVVGGGSGIGFFMCPDGQYLQGIDASGPTCRALTGGNTDCNTTDLGLQGNPCEATLRASSYSLNPGWSVFPGGYKCPLCYLVRGKMQKKTRTVDGKTCYSYKCEPKGSERTRVQHSHAGAYGK